MPGADTPYAIRGGQAGYDRLLLLASDRRADTLALFERAGLRPGMRCVDLGCGGGEVSFELARIVGPSGSVLGIDMDAVELDLARQAARDRGHANVEFRQLLVEQWDESGVYDFTYCRTLLQHLRQPAELLRRMWTALRPGGLLVVEDTDFDGCTCHPPNAGFDFFWKTYRALMERRGGDAAIGRKLYGIFLELGIPKPEVRLVQSARVRGIEKSLPWTTLDFTADAIVSGGVASRAEVNSALADLKQFTDDPTSLLTGPRIFQVYARK